MVESLINVRGLKELDRTLRTLPKKVGRRALLTALRKGAKPLVQEMRDAAPRDRGDMANSIAARSERAQRGSTDAVVKVGPTGKEGSLAHLVEFPTRPHKIRAKPGKSLPIGGDRFVAEVRHPGTPGQPFARPSFDRVGEEVRDITGRELIAAIERAARREAKKAGLLR